MAVEDDNPSIDDKIRELLTNDTLREQAECVAQAKEILGLKERRTLSQILKDQTLVDKRGFNIVLANLALAWSQYRLAFYSWHQHPEILDTDGIQRLSQIDWDRLQIDAAKCAIVLNQNRELSETTYTALGSRIYEQEEAFLQTRFLTVPFLTTADLQLHEWALSLTADELTSPSYHRVTLGDAEIRSAYNWQRALLPKDRSQKDLAFPNELRAAVGLKPLK